MIVQMVSRCDDKIFCLAFKSFHFPLTREWVLLLSRSSSSVRNYCLNVFWKPFMIFFIWNLKQIFLMFQGLIKRCYQCRSRGELGSCKDPFRFNASHVEAEPGVSTVPCASGWCGKVIEGETGAFREDGKINQIIIVLLRLSMENF